jgi:hypothetical protein
MNDQAYTYRAIWSPEDGEYVGLCNQFPSLSWLAHTESEALAGHRSASASGDYATGWPRRTFLVANRVEPSGRRSPYLL